MLQALDEPIDGLVVASPANPTGTVLAPDELAAIASWCEANGVQLVSDEIYHGITYGAADTATSSAWKRTGRLDRSPTSPRRSTLRPEPSARTFTAPADRWRSAWPTLPTIPIPIPNPNPKG